MATEALTSLKRQPEVATQIGLIMADFALIEFNMFIIYAAISPKNPMESFSKFYKQISANNKSKLVLDESLGKISEKQYLALQRLWKRFKGAAIRRNEIAHCVFTQGPSSQIIRLRLNGLQPVFEEFSSQIFDRTISQYHILYIDSLAFLTSLPLSEQEFHHIMHALPRAPHLETLAVSVVPDHQQRLQEDELTASRIRQGLVPEQN
jgi:hypothetical protein